MTMDALELKPLLRRRVGPSELVSAVPIGVRQPKCDDKLYKPLGLLPSAGFMITYAVFLVVGVGCALLPPRVRDTSAGEAVPADANCYRVVRKADYVTVEYAIGGPTRRVQVLLRLDRVVDDADHSVHIFSERTIESRSVQCDAGNSTCYDTVLASDGEPNEPLKLFGLQFQYTNPTVEYEKGDVARYRLGLAGEMYAARGYRYYLTNTHLCVSRADVEVADTGGALRAHVTSTNHVQTNSTNLAGMDTKLMGQSAVYQAYHGSECIGQLGEIDVLPYHAASETLYLAISDSTIYETEPAAVSIRREIAELGYVCAGSLTRYELAFNMYDFDCNNPYARCRTAPSLPFRRVSTYDVRAHYTQSGAVYYWFEHDASLDQLPGLANSAEAVWLAVVKLSLLILAAAVMWVRSDRVTSSSHWLYRHCVQIANCRPVSMASTVASSVVEDAALGLTALVARAVVAYWRLGALASEDMARVCVVELVASGVSLVSWVLRFWVIEPNLPSLLAGESDGRGPLTRLGGSMAIVDASCAVLLAFAQPPIHLSAVSRFDDTARLLSGLVISLVTLHRCLFAVACNCIMLEAHELGRLSSSPAYVFLVTLAACMWVAQTISIAVALADLVASPMAFTLTRGVIGDDVVVGVALFLALVSASLPRLMHTAVKLTEFRHDK